MLLYEAQSATGRVGFMGFVQTGGHLWRLWDTEDPSCHGLSGGETKTLCVCLLFGQSQSHSINSRAIATATTTTTTFAYTVDTTSCWKFDPSLFCGEEAHWADLEDDCRWANLKFCNPQWWNRKQKTGSHCSAVMILLCHLWVTTQLVLTMILDSPWMPISIFSSSCWDGP